MLGWIAIRRRLLLSEPPIISTPCVGVCQAPGGVCVGCGRTLAEIAAWSTLSEAERQRIMREELPRRRAVLQWDRLDSALGDSAVAATRD